MEVTCNKRSPYVWRIRLAPGARERIVLSEEGLAQLQGIIDEAAEDADCRVLVLEGTQGRFCEGMDLQALIDASPPGDATDAGAVRGDGRDAVEADAAGGSRPVASSAKGAIDASPPGDATDAGGVDVSWWEEGLRRYGACLLALREAPQAVVCVLDGAVLAGGMGFVAAADVVLASSQARFGLPEITLGLLPATLLPLLFERMTPHKARRFALMGATIDAQTAWQWGLVDEVVEPARLEKALRRELRQLLRAHPGAIARLKRLSLEFVQGPLAEAVVAGARSTAQTLSEVDHRAQIAAFLAGESPRWHARYRPDERSG